MLKIKYDPYNEIDLDSKKIVIGKNKHSRFRATIEYAFAIRYNKDCSKGLRYRVIAGCRDYSIENACHHWLSETHHSYERRVKTLRKLFKLYGVEKRRIPKQYHKILGY